MGFKFKHWMYCSHKPPWRKQRYVLKKTQRELSCAELISSNNPQWAVDVMEKNVTGHDPANLGSWPATEEKSIYNKSLFYGNPAWARNTVSKTNLGRILAEQSIPLKEMNNNTHSERIPGCGRLETLGLEEIVTSLEDGSLAHLSLEDLVRIICKCTKEKNLALALRLHTYMQNRGLDAHRSLGNYLVSMLVDVGSMSNAQKVFDMLVSRSDCSWNALINGYIKCGKSKRALTLYKKMLEESRHPSGYTFVALLRICTKMKDVETGRKLHVDIAQEGLLNTNLFVGNALIDMYAKCGSLVEAQEVFDILPNRTVVTWTALIGGYAQNEHGNEALKCFEQMQHDNVTPNAVTYACSLKACGSIRAVQKGKELHAEVEREGLLQNNQYVGNALVDMYAKCGMLAKAQSVFDKLVVRDAISFNALIAGYAEQEQGEEALACYQRMTKEGFSPDVITYTCILKACGRIGAIDKGREIHNAIKKKGMLKRDILLGSTLVDMYAKCGALAKAQEVFDQLPVRDTLTWTALITGYAQQGKTENVLHFFDRMRESGIKPDSITFLSVLSACSHAGLVDKGQTYYEAMYEDGLVPSVKHHSCIVDLLGRAGQLDWVVAMMKRAPFQPTIVMWLTVLTASRKWANVELGRQAFEQAVKLDRKEPASYVCMANIYADAGMHKHAMEVEIMRVQKQASNDAWHCSWIDSNGTLHSFSGLDKEHPISQEIYTKLEELSSKMQGQGQGNSPGFCWLPQDDSNGTKAKTACTHSERLAVACALLNTRKGASILLVKNGCSCIECHSGMALISRLENRSIHLRDQNTLHYFHDGICDCK